MRIIIAGYNSEPERYDGNTQETDLVIDVDVDDQDSPITLIIDQALVCVKRADLVATLKLLRHSIFKKLSFSEHKQRCDRKCCCYEYDC